MSRVTPLLTVKPFSVAPEPISRTAPLLKVVPV